MKTEKKKLIKYALLSFLAFIVTFLISTKLYSIKLPSNVITINLQIDTSKFVSNIVKKQAIFVEKVEREKVEIKKSIKYLQEKIASIQDQRVIMDVKNSTANNVDLLELGNLKIRLENMQRTFNFNNIFGSNSIYYETHQSYIKIFTMIVKDYADLFILPYDVRLKNDEEQIDLRLKKTLGNLEINEIISKINTRVENSISKLAKIRGGIINNTGKFVLVKYTSQPPTPWIKLILISLTISFLVFLILLNRKLLINLL
jgi:hypothetical protein